MNVKVVFQGCNVVGDKPGSDADVEVIYDKVYENFVEEVDAIDNGINIAEGKQR